MDRTNQSWRDLMVTDCALLMHDCKNLPALQEMRIIVRPRGMVAQEADSQAMALERR